MSQPRHEHIDPVPRWLSLGSLPVAAALLVALNAAYIALVAFGNITDFGTNREFVRFFGGFIVIGGEWFQMWKSEAWNGLDPAFRNSAFALITLVVVHLPSPQWTPDR